MRAKQPRDGPRSEKRATGTVFDLADGLPLRPEIVETVAIGGRVVMNDGKISKVVEKAVILDLQERSDGSVRRTATDRFINGRGLTPPTQWEQANGGAQK